MPEYSYKCSDCNNKFNIQASIKQKEQGGNHFNCPKCNSKNTKEVFSLKSFFSNDKNDGGGCCCSGECK